MKCLSSRRVPGRSEAPPGLEAYFFFDFLAFFAFFAFFAFLAIVSSQSLMDGNATRGMLGGGPASQHPRNQSQQIRSLLPHTVTSPSLRYPQLLCIFGVFYPFDALRAAKNRASHDHRASLRGLTMRQRGEAPSIDPALPHRIQVRNAPIFINSKPRHGLPGRR
jgi:hypothetical protein